MTTEDTATLATQLARYAKVLHRYREYWHFIPFAAAGAGVPWVNPALQQALDALSLEEIDRIDRSPSAQRAFFQPFFGDVLALLGITLASNQRANLEAGGSPQEALPFWLSNGIGGRKLSQIEAFIAQLPELRGRTIEWCAGKGHLGRLLRFRQQHIVGQVESLEWQPELCEEGQALAQQYQIAQTFQSLDVLSAALEGVLDQAEHAIALHACGDLHRHLLQAGSQAQLNSLHVAPCCYHLTQAEEYRPLSSYADALEQQQPLQLTKAQLKLAVQGQVTAGERVRRLRYIETLWRLVYQVARERYLGDAVYRPLPSLNKKWFSGDLLSFIQWASAHHEWQLPSEVDLNALQAKAQQRQLQVQRLELVRHVFRRPLEQYLVLDRAVFLQEQGYQVALSQFCDYRVSPRNFLLQAWRSEAQV